VRILVTRPEPAATRTADKLKALGHVPVTLPLARARHDPQAALRALKGNVASRGTASAQIIAVTSAEALRALESLGDELHPHLDRPVFAVGQATASAASAIGFRNITIGEGNGADLGSAIARTPEATRGVTYLAGRPRARGLEDRLAAEGIPVSIAVCYTMQPLVHDRRVVEAVMRPAPPEGVLVYSAETARALLSLLESHGLTDTAADMVWYPLSAAIAAALPAFCRVGARPAHADEDLLLASLG
jgi:uroporphyrinogen-III synthase